MALSFNTQNLDTSLNLDATTFTMAPVMDTQMNTQSIGMIDAMSPTPLAVLGGTAGDFAASVSAIRGALAPASPLDSLLADIVVLAAARLRRAAEAEAAGAASDSWMPLARLGEQSLFDALNALEARRDRGKASWGRPAPEAPRPFDPTELPPLPMDDSLFGSKIHFDFETATEDEIENEIDAVEETKATTKEASPFWCSRLIFDENISSTSPVVRGTWVTASQVVTLIVDGWTWADILRAHPEMIEDDIRACLDYTVEEERTVRLT